MTHRLAVDLAEFLSDNAHVLKQISDERGFARLVIDIADGCVLEGEIRLKFKRKRGKGLGVMTVLEPTH